MRGPIRRLRDARADRKAAKAMTPMTLQVCRIFGVPPRMVASLKAQPDRKPLCPAPDGIRGVCLAPIPCAEHNVTSSHLGFLLYGNTYIEQEVSVP